MDAEEKARAARAVQSRMAERRLSPAAVQRAAGVDPKTLRALLRGDRWPTLPVRGRVERALGWEPGELLRRARGVMATAPAAGLAGVSTDELLAEVVRRGIEFGRRRGREGNPGGNGRNLDGRALPLSGALRELIAVS